MRSAVFFALILLLLCSESCFVFVHGKLAPAPSNGENKVFYYEKYKIRHGKEIWKVWTIERNPHGRPVTKEYKRSTLDGKKNSLFRITFRSKGKRTFRMKYRKKKNEGWTPPV